MVSPLFMQWVVDQALVTADRDLLLTLALGFSCCCWSQTAVSAMRGWMLMVLGASLKVQARANLFSHLLNLPASYFESRHLGDVMSRFGSQETILQAITTEVVEAVLDGLMAGITLVIMFVFAPTLALSCSRARCCTACCAGPPTRRCARPRPRRSSGRARRDSHFLETLRGIKTIKLFNGQDDRRAHWLNLLVETVNRQLTTQKLRLAVPHRQLAAARRSRHPGRLAGRTAGAGEHCSRSACCSPSSPTRTSSSSGSASSSTRRSTCRCCGCMPSGWRTSR